MGMYTDIHHLGDLAEATHGADSSGDNRWSARPRAEHIGFKALESELAARGAANPGGLARYIGIKKYGHARFAAMAAAGRHKAHAGHSNQLPTAPVSTAPAQWDPDAFLRVLREVEEPPIPMPDVLPWIAELDLERRPA